jgi:polar amino acid transport system ATP-binding protein
MSESTAQPMVRFEGVTKRYGALTVLDDLNLEIGRGEKVAIIGPSGSGKTTVLRMLMTLERIDGGVIWVDGEPLTHVSKGGGMAPADAKHLRRVRSKIGMVFQHFNLFPHMNALAMRPKVMLFDEVTSALDPELCGEVLQVIRKLGSEHDLTMLMVTHQMGFAKEFADRVCFFYQGKICEQGQPQQLFTAPSNDRTKQFLRAVLDSV